MDDPSAVGGGETLTPFPGRSHIDGKTMDYRAEQNPCIEIPGRVLRFARFQGGGA